MTKPPLIIHTLTAVAMLVTIGCANEDERLIEMAERHEQRQAEQNRRAMELQHETAEGARRLVEANAKAREEMATLQQAVQSEKTEVGRQRDELENERRAIAAARRFDSLVATAITNTALLLACLLPLVLAWRLLRQADEPASDQVVVETLLDDFSSVHPRLFVSPPGTEPPGLAKPPRLPGDSNSSTETET